MRALSEHAPSGNFLVVPNGVDVDAFRPGRGKAEDVVFVGGTTWFPNKDALDYFTRSILPELRNLGVTAPIKWVGRATQAEVDTYGRVEGLHVTGYVTDIRPYLHKCACYIVPLRIGGGTRIKILDAWAMGMPVVSTSVGCEGLAAIDGKNILIRDDPKAFAEAIREILEDDVLADQLRREGRATVERIYSWRVIGETMLSRYRHLIDNEASRPYEMSVSFAGDPS